MCVVLCVCALACLFVFLFVLLLFRVWVDDNVGRRCVCVGELGH